MILSCLEKASVKPAAINFCKLQRLLKATALYVSVKANFRRMLQCVITKPVIVRITHILCAILDF